MLTEILTLRPQFSTISLFTQRVRFLRRITQLRRTWTSLETIIPQATGYFHLTGEEPCWRFSDQEIPVQEQSPQGLLLTVLHWDAAA